MQNLLMLLSGTEFRRTIILIIGFYLIYQGTKLMLKQNKAETSIEINFVGGAFKIKSPNAGIILCFLGFILVAIDVFV
jgi:uncharacterized membrane protein